MPASSGSIFTEDLGHSFSLYGPPSRQITYISLPLLKEAIRAPRLWCFASVNRFRLMYSEATSRIGHRNPLTDWPLYRFEWLCRVTLLSFVENKTAEKGLPFCRLETTWNLLNALNRYIIPLERESFYWVSIDWIPRTSYQDRFQVTGFQLVLILFYLSKVDLENEVMKACSNK